MAKKTRKPKVETRKIKIWCECHHREDTENLPEDWDEMSEHGRQQYLDEVAAHFHGNYASFGAEVVDDGEDEPDDD
jgi:hypothetical protein